MSRMSEHPPLQRSPKSWSWLWIAAAWLAFSVLLAPSASWSQSFGTNKVQYKNFHWQVLKTDHFDLYYYTGEDAAVQDAALMAERGYQRLSRALNHQVKVKIPLVLYASHTDFEQTNITPELLGIGTGGVTEFLRRRVFLPFTGSYADLDHVLTHELVHAFQVDILFGDVSNILSNPFGSTPPIWLMEGMAEYLSIGEVDTNTKMWLRDASLEGYLIPISVLQYVGDIRVYRFGQSIVEFIADNYGVQRLGEILKKTRRYGNFDRALESATGLTVDVLSKKWSEAVRKEYLPQIAEYDRAEKIADRVTDASRELSNFNVAPSVSPSGTQVVFISDRSMFNDVYLASALDGKVFKKLVEGERTGSFETLRFFNTSIAWSPDERQIALPAKIGGQDAIYLIKIPDGKILRKLKFGLDAIYSPAWSPDGKRLAFVGIKGGQSQLYVCDVDGKDFHEIHGGRYAVRDPAWSPDGGRIAYATDEGPETDVDRLIFGKLRIAILDVGSGQVTVLPNQRGTNISPQWGADGASIVFVSDRSGIPNIHKIDLTTGGEMRLSNLLTGVSGIIPESPCITLSRDGKRLLFSSFTQGAWDIYSVRDVPKFLSTPVPAATTIASAFDAHPEILVEAGSPEVGTRADSEPPPVWPGGVDSLRAATYGFAADTTHAAVDTTLAMYVRQVYREPLADSTTFRIAPYRAKFSRDYVVGGAMFASNVGFAGSTVISFSDVLGNHTLIAAVSLFGNLYESDVYLGYSNLSHRTNYAVAIYQYRADLLLLSSGSTDQVESQIYRGASFRFARPTNRFRRVEYGIEAAAVNSAVLLYNYDMGTVSQQIPDRTYYFAAPSVALVADNALYGMTGPINGGRSRYSAEYALGDVSYATLTMDWRRYTNIARRYSFAQRLIAGTSFGRDPRIFRFGGAFTFRGTDYGALRGTNVLIGNLEFRFPLIEQLRFGWPRSLSLGGINGVAFLDGASSWFDSEPRFFSGAGGFHSQDLRLAYGLGARMNLGYFMLRYDVGWRSDIRRSAEAHQFLTFGADF